MIRNFICAISGFLFINSISAQTPFQVANLKLSDGKANPVFIIDSGKEGLFYLDSADKTSENNDGTIIVTNGGFRYKRVYSGPVSAKWFGLKEGSVVDNSPALVAAIGALKSGQELVIESGSFFFKSPVIIPRGKKVKLTSQGVLYFPVSDGLIVEGTHELNIDYMYGSASQTHTALTLVNLQHSDVKIGRIEYFDTGIKMTGANNNGSQYNKVTFQSVVNNKTGILLTTSNTGINWVNENTFTGGRLAGGTGLKAVPGSGQIDPFNNNKFYNIGFEGLAKGIEFSKAKFNQFLSPRFEQVTDAINLSADSSDNSFIGTFFYQKTFKSPGIRTLVVGKLLTDASSVSAGVVSVTDGSGRFVAMNTVQSNTADSESNPALVRSIVNLNSLPRKSIVTNENYYTIPADVSMVVMNSPTPREAYLGNAMNYPEREITIKNMSATIDMKVFTGNGLFFTLKAQAAVTFKSVSGSWINM